MKLFHDVRSSRASAAVVIVGFLSLLHWDAFAQFSPGELSRAHHQLEGSQNCIKCHEVGREISGKKCLGCHEEIRTQLDSKHGYHYAASSDQCVSCHKEHLGRDAKTVLFDEKNFDHTRSGFFLAGKHRDTQCESCHTRKNIRDQAVQKMLQEFPHKTFLGLSPACMSCHEDPHRGQFKQDCASCHNTTAWSRVKNFDHSKTQFPLEGQHRSVSCDKCHLSLRASRGTRQTDFKTASFSDCSPCHRSPHASKFQEKECKTCHTALGWGRAVERSFDHNMTSFKLIGQHATVRCDQCHHTEGSTAFAKRFRMRHEKCTDCHSDKHGGEFLKDYKNDCAACHTEQGFKPSTFTLKRHERTRFSLTGGHIAVLCSECHRRAGGKDMTFRFASIRCESCHSDVHRGQFAAIMGSAGCTKCHSTNQWKQVTFNHSQTKFPLHGKHEQVPCSDCHKRRTETDAQSVVYRNLHSECQSCHQDIHRGQFSIAGQVNCGRCHTVDGWQKLVFDHEKQSTFRLTGAHQKVACRECHHAERDGDAVFTRFKPLSVQCEACHQQGVPK
jgi:hypothetical protein